MATFVKAVQISKSVNNVTRLFTNLILSQNVNSFSNPMRHQRVPTFQCALIHSTPKYNDLMEFFDVPKNWDKDKIPVGRSWRKDELRLKNNEELHKLWYVLLKERNMLLTMEEYYKNENKYFPNPERIDKVEDSMFNLESVVRERNKAYYMLETGVTGERPALYKFNPLGLHFIYRMRQYSVPKFMNTKWSKKHKFGYQGYAVQKFLRLYREKLWNEKRKLRNRQTGKVTTLVRTFPNLDMDAVKEQYPLADIEKIKKRRKAEGHFVRD
ncbi:39S ribosomal protein L47, mitochondrial [Eufriesea mexicana]|uniref:Large ribosomal subunit protein uL29m n=1 Tax=Eufriesea mexicana TaxID=516756 RepID=A0A310SNF0_9HYME|nr:PREDICTED: 39S ribosomal protein L47, mitochondrial [Eufriesea mexicana]OAD58791.1 39S ribosomal protein L47, mitochondrial [Eufriesea mexicana]